MKEIPLTQGKAALVDDQDYDWLNQWKWCAAKAERGGRDIFYAVRSEQKRTIYMHRQIVAGAEMVDHRDHDGLNNQRHNLRASTRSGNTSNSRKRPGCSSRFKGVTWRRDRSCWKAAMRVGDRHLFLGLHDSEVDAARAYDRAAVENYGEFACLNFPE